MPVDDDNASSGNESDLSSMRKIPLQDFVALFQWKYIFFLLLFLFINFGGVKIWNAGITFGLREAWFGVSEGNYIFWWFFL